MALHSFAPLCRKAYGAGAAAILPLWLQGVGRGARFWRIRRRTQCRRTGIKLSSAGTLATIFGRKHDIHLITPMTKLAILEYPDRSEEHTSELQSQFHLVCRLLL